MRQRKKKLRSHLQAMWRWAELVKLDTDLKLMTQLCKVSYSEFKGEREVWESCGSIRDPKLIDASVLGSKERSGLRVPMHPARPCKESES